jgi:hypothetical protein
MADITALILAKTDIGKQAANLAKDVCVGNERKSWLDKATAEIRPDGAVIQFHVRLRNQSGVYVRNPMSGDNVRVGTAFSDTSTAKFTGFMGADCTVQAYTVTSVNEIYQVLGAFATLLVNSGPVKLVLVSEICPMVHRRERPDTHLIKFSSADFKSGDEEKFKIDADQCRAAFNQISQNLIQCKSTVTLTDAGKKDLQEKTYGVIVDAKADIFLNIKRSEIPSWFRENFIHIPQQHIAAVLSTNEEPLPIDFTIAPIVTIVNRRAVSASINMDNVTGVPSYIGDYLKNEVNSNDQLNRQMVDFVNNSGILG